MSMDSTVVKKNICRKKSDTRPTTAKRQNSCRQDTLISYGSCGDNGKYFDFRKKEIQQTFPQSAGLTLFYWQILLPIFCNSWEFSARKVCARTQECIYSDSHSLFFSAIKHQKHHRKNQQRMFSQFTKLWQGGTQSSQSPARVFKSQTASNGDSFLHFTNKPQLRFKIPPGTQVAQELDQSLSNQRQTTEVTVRLCTCS